MINQQSRSDIAHGGSLDRDETSSYSSDISLSKLRLPSSFEATASSSPTQGATPQDGVLNQNLSSRGIYLDELKQRASMSAGGQVGAVFDNATQQADRETMTWLRNEKYPQCADTTLSPRSDVCKIADKQMDRAVADMLEEDNLKKSNNQRNTAYSILVDQDSPSPETGAINFRDVSLSAPKSEYDKFHKRSMAYHEGAHLNPDNIGPDIDSVGYQYDRDAYSEIHATASECIRTRIDGYREGRSIVADRLVQSNIKYNLPGEHRFINEVARRSLDIPTEDIAKLAKQSDTAINSYVSEFSQRMLGLTKIEDEEQTSSAHNDR